MLYPGLSHIDLPAKLEKSVSNGGNILLGASWCIRSFISENLQLLLPRFSFSFSKIFWLLLTSKNYKLKKGFTVLVSSQKDNREKISASNDHFARRDLGEFQDKR